MKYNFVVHYRHKCEFFAGEFSSLEDALHYASQLYFYQNPNKVVVGDMYEITSSNWYKKEGLVRQ